MKRFLIFGLSGMFCASTQLKAQEAASAVSEPATSEFGVSAAVEPLISDRPDFTESAETVPRNQTQIEAGYTFSRSGSTRDHTIGEVLVRHALNRRVELRVGLNSYQIVRDPIGGNVSGKDDPSIGFKVKLRDGSEKFALGRPDIALIVATTLPVGSRSLRENRLQPGGKLCLAWPLSSRTGLAANLNYDRASEGGRSFDQFSASASLGYSLSERVGAFVEVYGFSPGSLGGRDTKYFDGGLTYSLNPDFQLDVRAGLGLDNRVAPDYFVGAGVARRF